MAQTYDGMIEEIHKRAKMALHAEELPEDVPGEVLTRENNYMEDLYLVEYYKNPEDVNIDNSFLQSLRDNHTTAELEAWLARRNKGEWWPRLTTKMKHALLHGVFTASKEKPRAKKGVAE
jgi:hypothetical protein